MPAHLSEIQFRVLRKPSGHTLSHAESAFGPMGRPDASLSVCAAPSHRKGSRSSMASDAITYLGMQGGCRLLGKRWISKHMGLAEQWQNK